MSADIVTQPGAAPAASVPPIEAPGGGQAPVKPSVPYGFCSGAVLGFTFGTLIGLSNSPVIGAAIAAVFALATAYLNLKQASNLVSEKLLWGCAIGLLAGVHWGIIVRANNLLQYNSYGTENVVNHISKLGFSKQQQQDIIIRNARAAAGKYRNLVDDCRDLGFSDSQINLIMERMAKDVVLAVNYDSPKQQSDLATNLSSTKSAAPNTAPGSPQPSPSGIWTSGGQEWLTSLSRSISSLPPANDNSPEAIASEQAIETEVRRLRSLLRDITVTANPSDPNVRSILKDYDDLFSRLLNKGQGTLPERLDGAREITDRISGASQK